MTDDHEVRVTSATGGQKNSKDRRYDLIPVGPLDELARLYAFGAAKYAAHNWRKGYDWSLSYAAAQRHLTQFWNGEDLDEETGLPHLAAVAFHAFAMLEFMKSYREGDDRPPPSGTLFVEEPERKQVSTPLNPPTTLTDFYDRPSGDETYPILPVGASWKGRRRVHSADDTHDLGVAAFGCLRCDYLEKQGYAKALRSWNHSSFCPLFVDAPSPAKVGDRRAW